MSQNRELGWGRGYIINLSKQKSSSAGSNHLQVTTNNDMSKEIKSNFIHYDEKPTKSTHYIPPEPNQNDEYIVINQK